MRLAALLALILSAGAAFAQSSIVSPGELELSVSVDRGEVAPFQGEMVLITIHGIYRRHITREKLIAPDLDGFNWMQLGNDHWYETRIAGRPVKNFRRRMALFPDRAGELTIGPFTHHLTLTDEGDDWFDHDITSEPVSISVAPQPETDGWWFPVRRLEVSDNWSNAPDQLAEGEGVLRVIRVQATGVSPEMIPPMPELISPSALIFPHPEKRFVELSPDGPVSVAYWRWTIRPTNDTSAILEPITFDYFDTTTRQSHEVTISAQRVAIDETTMSPSAPPPDPARLRPALAGGVALIAFGATLAVALWGRRLLGLAAIPALDPLRRSVRQAGRSGDPVLLRRAAARLLARDGGGARAELLAALDTALFAPEPASLDTRDFARHFLAAHPEGDISST